MDEQFVEKMVSAGVREGGKEAAERAGVTSRRYQEIGRSEGDTTAFRCAPEFLVQNQNTLKDILIFRSGLPSSVHSAEWLPQIVVSLPCQFIRLCVVHHRTVTGREAVPLTRWL